MATALPTLPRASSTTNSFEEKEKGDLSIPSPSIDYIPPLGQPLDDGTDRVFQGATNRWLDEIATQPSVFDDPVTLEVYRPPTQYENAHRFDPLARWTWREEKAIVRKIDWRVMTWAFVMFASLDLDRSNISQANSDNLLVDLGMTTNDYNIGFMLFRLAFFCAELPSQLISKRVGPDVWIPTQMVLWSIVSCSQFWITGKSTFLATRALLGLLQGGFIPDVVLYLSYFYTKRELPMRLAFFWVSNYLAEIVGAFMATGILQLRGLHGKSGWRYLFLIEGLITLIIGVASFFMMPPGPTQTKTWYRPNGWFTEREEIIVVNRVLRDDPTKSDMHNRQGLSMKMIFWSLCDWQLWPLYILGLTFGIPTSPPQQYMTLTLKNLGFTTIQTNLLTIPASVLGVIGMLTVTFVSERMNSRVIPTVFQQIWVLPLVISLECFTAQTSQWVYYAVVFLVVGYPYAHPVQVAWASRNSYSVRTRTVSASAYNMFVQLSSVISSNIYRADDKPLYKRGNLVLIVVCVFNICFYAFTFFFYRTINRRRDAIWASMTPEEQADYLESTKDEGNKRLDFRFAY